MNSSGAELDKEVEKEKLTAQLKGKLWYCIEKQVNEETPFDATCTPKFINALVELCYIQLVEMGKDLELFAKHGGRNIISTEDLILLLRKAPKLQELLIPNHESQ